MRKKLWAALALTMVIVGAALVWGLGGVSRVTAPAFSLDLDRLRAAALASGEPLPLAMGEHVIAFGDFPKGAVIAGESLLEQQRLVFRTHVLGYADGRTVVIDPVHGADLHEKFYGQGFNPRAWAVMQDALVRSSLVLATHEHFDHVAGIAQASNFSAVRDKVMLSREQLHSDAIEEAGFSEEQLNQLASFDYDDYYSPAPGIALKKAPSHSPGSQMIFVRFADGNEVLFVGDVAWSWQNLLEERGRPRFVSALIGEDGVSVAAQLATLRALFLKGEMSSAVPSGVQLVISHEMRPHTD